MSKILALDTSTDNCSVALMVDKQIDERLVVAPKGHTNFILSMIDDLLNHHQLKIADLDALAFGCGPGSFTGVRLAASITQGLAASLDLPVVSISTLRTMAQEIFQKYQHSSVIVAQDARMQEIYLGQYVVSDQIMQPIAPDSLIKAQELKNFLQPGFVGVGSGFRLVQELIEDHVSINIVPTLGVSAKYLVQIAEYDFLRGFALPIEKSLPIYLRDQVTSL